MLLADMARRLTCQVVLWPSDSDVANVRENRELIHCITNQVGQSVTLEKLAHQQNSSESAGRLGLDRL